MSARICVSVAPDHVAEKRYVAEGIYEEIYARKKAAVWISVGDGSSLFDLLVACPARRANGAPRHLPETLPGGCSWERVKRLSNKVKPSRSMFAMVLDHFTKRGGGG